MSDNIAAKSDGKSPEAPTTTETSKPLGSDVEAGSTNLASNPDQLRRGLKGRHMQMIAMGGAIGAGLFVGSGSSLQTGGPASLILAFAITGVMVLCTVLSLAEMAVLYPVNGAFYMHTVRFLDPAWGFAMAWQYALGWLLLLPFEITAAGITISYWHEYNIGIWVVVFMVPLVLIQVFGVRGYGEVEFILGLIKVIAMVGFILFGIIDNCGGVPTDDRGYIGFRYWNGQDGNYAFRNGFKGFCSVFVLAAFAFGGTEMVGLAAAEATDPKDSIPKATKQVFWRIAGFYIVSLLMIGILVPNGSADLLGSSGANTKASPFVLSFQYAGVQVLPSIFNVVITLSVLSVANSCTYGSTRVMQALAHNGMGPKWLAYIDEKGRPVWCVVIQLLFGLLAFINEAAEGDTIFTWLLALSGLSSLFIWGSICASHIRFRHVWKSRGRSADHLPFQSQLGVAGSWVGLVIVILSLIATFYVALFPIGESPSAELFFETYLAAPVIVPLYLGWKFWAKDWSIWVKAESIDIDVGRRAIGPVAPMQTEVKKSFSRKVMGAIF